MTLDPHLNLSNISHGKKQSNKQFQWQGRFPTLATDICFLFRSFSISMTDIVDIQVGIKAVKIFLTSFTKCENEEERPLETAQSSNVSSRPTEQLHTTVCSCNWLHSSPECTSEPCSGRYLHRTQQGFSCQRDGSLECQHYSLQALKARFSEGNQPGHAQHLPVPEGPMHIILHSGSVHSSLVMSTFSRTTVTSRRSCVFRPYDVDHVHWWLWLSQMLC